MIKPPSLPDMTIVLADASEYQRRLIREALRSTGIRKVYEIGDASSVVPVVRQIDPDVLILDVDLPGSNTLLILRDLMEPGVAPRPVILTVSRPTVQFVEAAMKLGQRDIIARPIKPSSLWARLSRFVAAGRVRTLPLRGSEQPSASAWTV